MLQGRVWDYWGFNVIPGRGPLAEETEHWVYVHLFLHVVLYMGIIVTLHTRVCL